MTGTQPHFLTEHTICYFPEGICIHIKPSDNDLKGFFYEFLKPLNPNLMLYHINFSPSNQPDISKTRSLATSQMQFFKKPTNKNTREISRESLWTC